MVTLIFWQNIVSPHQLPYIREIGNIDLNINVILVAGNNIMGYRDKMGWKTQEVNERNNLKVITSPSNNEIHELFTTYPNAKHFFSGIQSNPMVFDAFKKSLREDVKRYLIAEGPFLYKHSAAAHYIKTIIKDLKYYRYIDKVFAIGSHALKWYPNFNFNNTQIIPFSYCVEKPVLFDEIKAIGPTKILFVGGLIHRKGVDILLKALKNLKVEYVLDIIGDGDQREYLERFCNDNRLVNVNFLGTIDNNETREKFKEYDIHILPSRHDGWGAVINEALMSGLFVICSENCGAKELIKQEFNGLVFSHRKKNDLYNALLYCIVNIDTIRMKKQEIRDWSKCIEGASLARYFIKTLSSDEPVTPPWKNFEK